ncbi:MAG: hypothetical protein V3U32_07730 [Anaerolineales bacterium]
MDAIRRVQGRLSNTRPFLSESLGLSLYALSVPVLLFPVGAPWLAIPLSLAQGERSPSGSDGASWRGIQGWKARGTLSQTGAAIGRGRSLEDRRLRWLIHNI